jgi:hypothetical protein
MSERPLHEYIDLEVYGVVTREQYEKAVERAERAEAALLEVDALLGDPSGNPLDAINLARRKIRLARREARDG